MWLCGDVFSMKAFDGFRGSSSIGAPMVHSSMKIVCDFHRLL